MHLRPFCLLALAAALLSACSKPADPEAAAEARHDADRAAEKQEESKPLAQQRGLQNFRSGNSRSVVLVKAPLSALSDTPLKRNPTREVITGLKGKQITLKAKSYMLLQIKGHDWTAISNLTKGAQEPEKLAGVLAGILKTKAVYYSYSSFSSTTRYRLYEGAEEIEALDTLDADDAKLLLEHGGAQMDPAQKKILEEVRDNNGARFHSKTRKLMGDEKRDGDMFVNRALKEEDAFLPDLAGSFLGDAGGKMDIADLPLDPADIEAIAVIQADNVPTPN